MVDGRVVVVGSGGRGVRSRARWATGLLALAVFALGSCGSDGWGLGCLGIGEMRCDGSCVNTYADPMNCGTCGRVCASCDWGQCRCGGSLVMCEREHRCVASSDYTVARCVGTCSEGLTNCVTSCADLANNSLHCGACGHACAADNMCVGGVCVCRQPGTERCGDVCVSTQNNPLHCGRCGAVCTGITSECSTGLCVCPSTRSGPLSRCGEACVDLAHDPANCGACRVACRPERVCSWGACADSCGVGMTNCDRSCRDTTVDPAHCGGCGIVCARACVFSQCDR